MGLLLFVLVTRLMFPFFLRRFADVAYEDMIASGRELPGLLLYIIHLGFSGAITASCSVLVSTFVTNRYAAAAAPVVVHCALIRVVNIQLLLDHEMMYLHPINWIEGIYNTANPWTTLLVKALTTVILCLAMFALTRFALRRKLAYA
jgi:hypothetical protein